MKLKWITMIVLLGTGVVGLWLGYRYYERHLKLPGVEKAEWFKISFVWDGRIESLHVTKNVDNSEVSDPKIRRLAQEVVKKFAPAIAKREGTNLLRYTIRIQLSPNENIDDISGFADVAESLSAAD